MASEKNQITVGLVVYFVGLSLLVLFIYRWSLPKPESDFVASKDRASSVSVQYESRGYGEADAALSYENDIVEMELDLEVPESEVKTTSDSSDQEESWD